MGNIWRIKSKMPTFESRNLGQCAVPSFKTKKWTWRYLFHLNLLTPHSAQPGHKLSHDMGRHGGSEVAWDSWGIGVFISGLETSYLTLYFLKKKDTKMTLKIFFINLKIFWKKWKNHISYHSFISEALKYAQQSWPLVDFAKSLT